MPTLTDLKIVTSQALSRSSPTPGQTSWGRTHGSPSTLLSWLETQLGLTGSEIPFTDRVTRYAALLEDHDGDTYRRSFEADRWATAAELLQRRDELRMAGWDGDDDEDHPALVRDLAAVEVTGEVPPGVPDRLEAILEALGRGQELPDHTCTVGEPVDMWPPRWRDVLDRLGLEVVEERDPAAPTGTTLNAVQAGLLGDDGTPDLDEGLSFDAVEALSVHEACQVVAAMLARDDEDLSSTVIYTPDLTVAGLLEGALERLGLSTMGARRDQVSQPALQVLPLVVEMLWEPVDPHVVLDFLSLPIGPIPANVAGKLARGLAEQPGLGSAAWEERRAECIEEDESGDVAERLEKWFDHDRVAIGEPVPAELLGERCRKVAQWARGYAEAIEDDDDRPEGLADALRTAATQAAALGQLAETQGGALSKPQVVRMLEDVRTAGARSQVHPAQAGGPTLVENLADVPATCERLIWLGTGLEDEPTSRWTVKQRDALTDAGIEVDDGARKLQVQRAAERRGLSRIAEAMVVIQLPADADRRPHPLWIRIGNLVDPLDIEDLPSIQDVLTGDGEIGPWTLETATVPVEPPQPERPLWDIPADLLEEPAVTWSGTMQDRLGCPIRWVFDRVADIESSSEATLPDRFRLKGRFCHQVLDRVFGEGGEPPPTDQAVRAVGECFDERVARDAAPLARPAKLDEQKELREQLQRATRVFVDALHEGGYRIVGIEQDLDAEVDGRPLLGRIDAVLDGSDGEALVDFKYGGTKKYRRYLKEGRGIQLAVYAAGRADETGSDELPDVAYLVLRTAQLYTPDGSPLDGVPPDRQIQNAPPIETVWRGFLDALDRSQGWLVGDEPVPARPLQPEDEWPAGTDLVVDADKDGKDRQPCKYCDYDVLCGLRRCP